MSRTTLSLVLTVVLAAGGSRANARAAAADSAASESFFEAKVRPVLAGTCVKCHGGRRRAVGFGSIPERRDAGRR